jgi:hypothetical protein
MAKKPAFEPGISGLMLAHLPHEYQPTNGEWSGDREQHS